MTKSDTIKAFAVDGLGYRSQTETFIYLIDLPPIPQLSVTPVSIFTDSFITCNGSKTSDQENPIHELVFRWDFEGDGTVDSAGMGITRVQHRYKKPGKYAVVLTVMDAMGHQASVEQVVQVYDLCPDGMVFIPSRKGKSFCIDQYEWPNKKGTVPRSNISWIQASLACFDEGKRLCTKGEWQYACAGSGESGVVSTFQLHDVRLKNDQHPAARKSAYASGSYAQYTNTYGIHDMEGNLWEWVADNADGNPVITGGSFTNGNRAQCQMSSPGTLDEHSTEIGFRCCR
jgi:hypothetical protein